MSTEISRPPRFYRVQKIDPDCNAIALRMFADRAGLVCVVSAPLPQWGLRVFTPTSLSPKAALEALPYAQFLMGFLNAERVDVQLDADIDWHAEWGDLVTTAESEPTPAA